MAELPNIVSFSGGQTSGYMLRHLMDTEPDFNRRFRVVFENTGKEHDATLDFVRDVEKHWSVPVTWLEYTRVKSSSINPQLVPEGRKRANLLKQQAADEMAHWFRVVDYEKAARRFDKVTPFDELLGWASVLPNTRTRMCSVQLKIRTRDRYLRANGVGEFNAFIGIRHDESHRKLEILANIDRFEHPYFPLCDGLTTKATVDAFWDSHPFRLNIPNLMGNCDLCFLKAKWKRLTIATKEPAAAEWWSRWEEKKALTGATGNGSRFRQGQSYAGLIHEAGQPTLALDDTEEDVPCSCAVGGYRGSNTDD